MKFDPHIHSVYSGDARSDPLDILIQAEKKGFVHRNFHSKRPYLRSWM